MNTLTESRNRRFIPPNALECLLSQPWLSKRMLVKIFAWYSTEPLFHRPGILHWIIFNFSSGRKNRVSYTLPAWLGFIYLFNGKRTPNWGGGGNTCTVPSSCYPGVEGTRGKRLAQRWWTFLGKWRDNHIAERLYLSRTVDYVISQFIFFFFKNINNATDLRLIQPNLLRTAKTTVVSNSNQLYYYLYYVTSL